MGRFCSINAPTRGGDPEKSPARAGTSVDVRTRGTARAARINPVGVDDWKADDEAGQHGSTFRLHAT